ncbi:uncharacterized protein Z520_11435 [Fonsecaea multimorphosa CBS 102226]|uniref:Methylated-DNA-[protein]-cysteine S-methyltransferase DNA binding domain-containing protein n=1 Tax=Fonsecaea multimorphosa CBS 102226 TaxID=1442371 RepID=A0A0D2JHV4_9EURO|nr:uncharacterized protein Z520_11435 [Fonsecaea multimorphosa CBS 102226]KIX92772.1 hypothetical protein Z520_11435 [Fonsecaea multimorphosa CBS 102226]OAL18022.1 hypothetical protein AYO22_11038 [Fonsecaea multimorphosa]
MTRSEETEWWINAVYEAIQQIPPGRVTTYKHIASLLGTPQRARQVGVCLSNLHRGPTTATATTTKDHLGHDDTGTDERPIEHYNLDSVPWQRVINSKGMISHRAPGWASLQAELLRREGVQVDDDGMGEYYIDFATFGWVPDGLPDENEEEA